MVLKRIGVFSAAKIACVLYAAMGVLTGLVFAVVFSALGALPSNDPDVPTWLAPVFGVGALVFMPLIYAVMGFIGGALGAVIYNLFTGVVGGLVLDLEPTARP